MRDELSLDRDICLGDMARTVFGDGVAIAVADPQSPSHALHPEERALVSRAVPKRRREFAAGRDAARQVLLQFGISGKPVLAGKDRAPIWPDGIVGSISHNESHCIAVAGHMRRMRSLGVDLETYAPLDDDLLSVVCLPQEQSWLNSQPEDQRGHLARLIFSAKECAYKCQYPLTKSLYGFDGMRVELGMATGKFRAVFVQPIGEFLAGDSIMGRFATGAGLVLTGAVMEYPPRDGV